MSDKKTEEKKDTFDIDKALTRLEEINTLLGRSGISLKESLELYKEGVQLAEQCKQQLEGVEKEIQILSEE